MQIQLIRNATLRMVYAGHTFLVDPYFAPKHSLPSFTGRSQNPMVDLPMTPEAIIAGIEMVLVSHLHTDHFDSLAQNMLPKSLPLFCQPGDELKISEKGFQNVTPISDQIEWQGINITRTLGRHGSSAGVLGMMGVVSGFVLQAANEPTVYWAGDTVFYDDVQRAIVEYQPDIIITHSGGAVWGDNELILMDAGQTISVCEAAPNAVVVATHLEALDHCLSTRADLESAAQVAGIDATRLQIPDDGAELSFGR
ncbi:MAG: MBL fold metallo-hydrolase [Chloroflexi bacterium]|nr:MBL fold metallo-hydrolase [Chloroflexota bacterium]